MFHAWESFYVTLGSASAGLIGLMFVVTTLTAGHDRSKAMRGASLYLTPVVLHFATVLAISAAALAPAPWIGVQAVLFAVIAIVGLGNTALAAAGIRSGEVPHWSDFWCYGVAPAMLYAVLLGGAFGLWSASAWALWASAGAAIALLLLSIRNAWDLVIWITPHRDDGEPTSSAAPPS